MVTINLDGIELNEAPIVGVVDSRPEDYWQLAEHAEARRGLYCRYATTARAALRLAAQVRPVLWLINFDLPDMAGLELCRVLQPRFSRVPHFCIADAYDPQVEIAVLSAGSRFLCKPVPGVILESFAAKRVTPRDSAPRSTARLIA